jgi:elongation factor 1-gamma
LWLQHFEGFDPEGFSIWFCEYKYPEENTVNYIVMNKARARRQAAPACPALAFASLHTQPFCA